MKIFFWIVDLLIPLTMVIFGTVFIVKPPNNINSLYGYRTSRSMSSQEAWNYAHKIAGKVWRLLGVLLFIFIVLDKLLIPLAPEYLSLINTGISLIVLISPIFYVEKKLKEKFHK